MEDTGYTEQKKRIAQLYKALREKNNEYVAEVCHELPEGPLQRISLHNDTVLHMAAHSKQKDLVLELLKVLPADGNHQFSDLKNKDGNTILHEVAASDAMKDVAEELLRRDANLLIACNDLGEKPIFCAARCAQTEMFEFLAKEMKLEEQSPEDGKAHLQRNDGTTVLHISIDTECFDLALFIVKHYPYLIGERDQSSMTALQYLACNPTAFRRGKTQIRRQFIEPIRMVPHSFYSYLLNGAAYILHLLSYSYLCSYMEDKLFPGRAMIRHERSSLEELVKSLVIRDTSWDASINSQVVGLDESKKEPKIEEHSSGLCQIKGGSSLESSTSKYKKSNENPLFLATMSNIKEIVKAVLDFQPQALEHTNKEGMNILHLAILYRHIDIFDMVVKSEVFVGRLLSAMDNEGNSVLHMVSQKRISPASEKMQSPTLHLRDELLLFEKVKLASNMHFSNPLNKENKTAEELFAARNEQLHQEAKEWLMRTTENCTIVSIFIATVAFAAVYTVPGGHNQNTGIPILNSKPFFMVFILADVISLTLALTSVAIFLSILTSPFPLEDFKTYLFRKLIKGIIYLVLSVSMMVVAFGATIVLAMTQDGKNVVWVVAAFLPVPIFFLSYSPLRSAVYSERFKIFVGKFLIVVAILVVMSLFFLSEFGYIFVILFLVLFFLPCGAFEGLRRTMKKACEFICKPVRWISGNKSQPESDTQSPQQTIAAPLTQV